MLLNTYVVSIFFIINITVAKFLDIYLYASPCEIKACDMELTVRLTPRPFPGF